MASHAVDCPSQQQTIKLNSLLYLCLSISSGHAGHFAYSLSLSAHTIKMRIIFRISFEYRLRFEIKIKEIAKRRIETQCNMW